MNKPYGPDTCKQGYVWRGTTPADHVRGQGERSNLTKPTYMPMPQA